MSQSQAQLDTAIQSLSQEVATVVADVNSLIAKLSASSIAPDFTSEVNSIQASLSALQGADTAAQAAIAPPAAPATPAS